MANTPTVYVICDQNCKFEGMTREQIYTAILQAVNEGTIGDIDAGFVTTIKTINGLPLKFFVGEQSAYDELTEEEKENLFAVITNDATKEGILNALNTLDEKVSNILNGKTKVKIAEKAAVAELANGLECFTVKTIDDLDKLANNHTCSVVFDENTSVGGVLIPKYSKGIVASTGQDAILSVVCSTGEIYTAYRSNGTWKGIEIKKIPDKAVKATQAEKANSATNLMVDNVVTFGRELLWKGKKEVIYDNLLQNCYISFGSNLTPLDLLVVEFEVYSGTEYGSKKFQRFRSIPFYAEQIYTNIHSPCIISFGGNEIDFEVRANQLYFNHKNKQGGTTADTVYITAVYREL